ncbi:MAG TPA: TIGR02266 family protein [Polyangiaceae bacterium]|nr:TIGR02266 family protein [Polyangiaceae bacterium]
MLIDRSFSELLSADAQGAEDGDRTTDPTDRRSGPRVAIEVDVAIGGADRVVTGVSGDVSVGGLYVSTYRPLPEGTRVSVRFRLPTGQVMATGVVRWTREGRPGRLPGMGIELVELDEMDRDCLERFCGKRPRFLSYEEIVAKAH